MVKIILDYILLYLILCCTLNRLAVLEGLQCGSSSQQIPSSKFCDCKTDCHNGQDERDCTPLNSTKIMANINSCNHSKCALNSDIRFIRVCKPNSCNLWASSKSLRINQSNDDCFKLPCIRNCFCRNSEMICNDRSLSTVSKKVIWPYHSIIFIFNFLREFPIDTSINQPWIFYIDLYYNNIRGEKLSSEVLKNLPNLWALYLGQNPLGIIQAGTFKHLTKLQILSLSYDEIHHLDEKCFEGLNNLQYLKFTDNPIIQFPKYVFKPLRSLKTLIILTTNLIDLEPETLKDLRQLRHLTIANSYLRRIPNGTFMNNKELTYLNLESNKINFLSNYTFYGLNKLRFLNLKLNPIQHVINNLNLVLPMLSTLYISQFRNTRSAIKAMQNILHLETMNVEFGNMRDLGCDLIAQLPTLRKINLKNNQIETICQETFQKQIRLIELDLSANQISVLSNKTFSALSYLKTLRLAFNRIQQLSVGIFTGLYSLEKLDLRNNVLESIPETTCHGPSKLYQINLDRNRLKNLNVEILHNCSQSLTELYASQNSISYLNTTSLSTLSALKKLTLDYNPISIISYNANASIRPLPQLHELSIDNTLLKEIPRESFHLFENAIVMKCNSANFSSDNGESLSVLSNLQTLIIAGSQIHPNYTFSHHLSLTFLMINNLMTRNFKIRRETFQGLIKLKYLYLSFNYIQALKNDSFPSLPSLYELQLKANNISTIEPYSFIGLSNLRKLSLARNNLKIITRNSFNTLSNLQELNLEFNQISSVEEYAFLGMVNLIKLFLDSNRIEYLKENTFTGSISVLELHLTENNIEQFDINHFNKLPSLNFLDLGSNLFKKFQDLRTNYTTPAFKYLRSIKFSGSFYSMDNMRYFANKFLEQLECNKCDIRKLQKSHFTGVQGLKWIHIRSNLIQSLPEKFFYDMKQVRYIDLTLNGLTYFDFTSLEGLPNLLRVFLGYNYLTTFKNTAPANSVIAIEKLYAPDNFLTHLESDLFFNFPYLYYLFIPNNRLHALPDHLCNGTQLKMLDVSGNLIRKINRLQFTACNYLKTINLSGNKITTIETNTFIDVKALKEIRLNNNSIDRIPLHTFSSSSPLTIVNLALNKISFVDENAFGSLAVLQNLDLSRNRLTRITASLFANIPYLTSLNLTLNRIESVPDFVFVNLQDLETLWLGNERLRYLNQQAFHGLNRLKYLQIDYCRNLRTLNFQLFLNLKPLFALYLRFCNLSASAFNGSSFQQLSGLRALYLDNNDLSDIDESLFKNMAFQSLGLGFSKLSPQKANFIASLGTDLTNLYLDGLRLKDFINASMISKEIQNLYLNDNDISSIHASSAPILRSLKKLVMDRNNMGNQGYVTLITLTPNLIDLFLSENNISEICPKFLSSTAFSKIRYLNLNSNNIEKLDSYCFWSMPDLNYLVLKDNPLINFNSRSFGGVAGIRSIHSTREYLCCVAPSSVIVCRPNPNQFSLSTCYNILAHDLLRVFIWVIGIISVVGNTVSIRWHSQKYSSNKFGIVKMLLINLSTADFIMGIYLIVIASANVYYANRYYEVFEIWLRSVPCLTASFCISLSSLMSTFVLFLITLDRYLHLVFPFQNYRLSTKTTILALVVLWLISITFVGLPILYSINQPSINRLYSSNSACLPGNFNNPYLLTWLLCYAGLTLIVWIFIAIMYAAILSTLANSSKKTHRRLSRNDKIVRAKMITIVATDLICWLPLYIVLIRGFGFGLDTHSLPFIAVLSLPLNSCINPIIYTLFTTTFIDHINLAIGKLNCCSCLTFFRSIRKSTQGSQPQRNIYTGSIHPSHVTAISSNPDLSKVYIKVELPHNYGVNNLGWLQLYNAKDNLPWEKEISFYTYIKSKDCKLKNIMGCLWYCKGNECRIEIDGGEKLFPDKFITCFTADANDIMLLSNSIRLQSDYLTSHRILQISMNIIQAIQSLHLNNIVHGSINTDAVILLISPKEPITALLGVFSNTTIFENDLHEMHRNRYRQLMKTDISDFALLCSELSSYCQTIIDQINESQLQPDKVMQASEGIESWRSVNEKLRIVKDAIDDQLQENREPKQILADLWAITSGD